jgi:uncharacterized membrane protein
MTDVQGLRPDLWAGYVAIAVVALSVLATRCLGVLGGAVIRPGTRARRILNALPGCAMAAIVAPAAMRGTPTDIAAVALTFGLYLWTGRTIASLLPGLALCVLGAHWQAGLL